MRYRDVIDIVLPRAHRLGLVDTETGQVDAVEAEAALLTYIQRLITDYDLDAFTILNEAIATTSTARRDYALPEDFSRLLHPTDRDGHGMFIHDGTNLHRLRYRESHEWLRLQASANARPTYFTILGRDLQLDPPPDANSSAHYTVRGTYIQEIQDIGLDEDVSIPLATAAAGTLAEMARNFRHTSTPLLTSQSTILDSALIHAQRRTRQPFQKRAQWSRPRGIRR